MKLGTAIEQALKAVGITEQRVSRWIGHHCGCKQRRQRLDRLHQWAADFLAGRTTLPLPEFREDRGNY